MATVPTAKLWVDNTVPLASEFNSNIKSAIDFFKAPPRCIVNHNATIVRDTRTVWTLLPWNSTITETDGSGMHDNSTNNSRLIAQTAGRYHAWCCVTWEDHTSEAFDGVRSLQIRRNSGGNSGGGILVALDQRHCKTQLFGTQGAAQQGCDGFVSMSPGDYLEAFVFDADDDNSPTFPFPASGCYLEPQTWSAQRFGMNWVSI